MADDNNPSLGGFEAMFNMISGAPGSGETDDVNEPAMVDPDTIRKNLSDDDTDDEKDDQGDTTNTPDTDDDSDTNKPDSTTDDNDDTVDDPGDSSDSDDDASDSNEDDVSDGDVNLGEYESDIMAFLNDRFKEEIGWDIPEEDAPKNVGEFVKFMSEMVDEASQPKYANDEVAKYDEFVRNGGNLREFYKSVVDGRVDTESIDIENSYDQKRVLTEHLTNQGYSEDNISKKLQRWEEAGVLEDEASEALELLKNYNEKQEQKLLETQKKK
jgi:hypothetical protein